MDENKLCRVMGERRRTARPQLELLAQYMERYPVLALSHARSRDHHARRKQVWDKIARTLNRAQPEQARSGHGWHRYWLDLKFKIRRKYSVMQKCLASGAPCGVRLSALEQRLAAVLTDDKGNLLPAGPTHRHLRGTTDDNPKPTSDRHSKLDDFVSVNDADDSGDFLSAAAGERAPERSEHMRLPQSWDVKPDVSRLRSLADVDPIRISREDHKPLDELRREILEFELRRQKELFEIEKRQKIERHEMEMSILVIRKQMMTRELDKL